MMTTSKASLPEPDQNDDQGPAPTALRQKRYKRGFTAEGQAQIMLRLTGHRILARRFKTYLGEIDLITVRRRRIGFVEVKFRKTVAACEAAITAETRRRVRRSADLWFARNPDFSGYDVGFDLVFIVPWRWPILLRDAL